MILFEGNLLQDEDLDSVLESLWDSCLETIENRDDIAQKVIDACETVARKINIDGKIRYQYIFENISDIEEIDDIKFNSSKL